MKRRASYYILLGILLVSTLGVISGTLMWPKGKGVLHMLMSRKMLDSKDTVTAIDEAKGAVALMPGSYIAVHNLVEIYIRAGRYEEAEKAVEKLIELSPKVAGAYLDLGDLKLIRRDVLGAKEAAQKAISISPDYGECYYLLGAIAVEEGDIEKAKKDFRRALELNPGSYRSYLRLGAIYYESGVYDTAIEKLKKATELNPDLSNAHAMMGQIYLQQELYNHSLGQLTTAVDLDPSDYNSMYNIACVHSLQNNPAAAVKWLERSIDNGFTDLDYIGKDVDFDNIRNDPEFMELMKYAADYVSSRADPFASQAAEAAEGVGKR